MPLTTLVRNADPGRDAAAIAELERRHDVAEIVVGLPLDMSGGEGEQARSTRAWVDAIRPTVRSSLRYRDERLSSHLAEQRLGPMKRGRSGGPPTRDQRAAWRARVDREAAAITLQDELDARVGTVVPDPQTETTT